MISQSPSILPTKTSKENPTSTVDSIPKENIVLSPTVFVPHLDEIQIKQELLSRTIIPEDKLEFQKNMFYQ